MKEPSALPSFLPPSLVLLAVAGLVELALAGNPFPHDWLGSWRAGLVATAPFVAGTALIRGLWVWFRARVVVRRVVVTALAEIAVGWLLVGGITAVYLWAKLYIPYVRPLSFDGALYRADLAIHFGLDPSRVMLALIAAVPGLAAVVDLIYGRFDLFLALAGSWFLVDPDRDRRRRYVRGLVWLWMLGLAGYWLWPALGPAFVFPDMVTDIHAVFPRNFFLQGLLRENYARVLAGLVGQPARLDPRMGVAAMPSLHVAFPAYLLALALERRSAERWPLVALLGIFLIGSIATGWHYAVDAYVGLAIAVMCWVAVRRPKPAATAGVSE